MQTYDVAVIGGGLVGCATAYYLTTAGARVALIERGTINRYLSDGILAALFCPAEGHCNPRLLIPAFARKAAAGGVEIHTRCTVNGIGRRTGKWHLDIETHNGSNLQVAADAVLNAAGGWSAHLPQQGAGGRPNARRLSTRLRYTATWTRLSMWCRRSSHCI